MNNNNTDFKYETYYTGPFQIMQCWANSMVTLQYGAIKIEYNIYRIKTYTSDTNVEDVVFEN